MATLQSGKCFTVPTFFGMCCRSEWQERMYIYKWHEVDQTKHEIFCVHIVCNEIQVKVNLEITTFFFICVFHTVPTFSDLGLYLFHWKTMLQTVTLLWNVDSVSECLFLFWSVWIRPLPIYPIVFWHPGLPVGGKHIVLQPWKPANELGQR